MQDRTDNEQEKTDQEQEAADNLDTLTDEELSAKAIEVGADFERGAIDEPFPRGRAIEAIRAKAPAAAGGAESGEGADGSSAAGDAPPA